MYGRLRILDAAGREAQRISPGDTLRCSLVATQLEAVAECELEETCIRGVVLEELRSRDLAAAAVVIGC